MDTEEAKFILSSVRLDRPGLLGREAAENPAVAEALRLAESDSELGAWARRTAGFDAAVADRLAAVEVPADLKGAILAGGRASSAKRRRPRGGGVFFAAAAALALGLVALRWLPVPGPDPVPAGETAAAFADIRNGILAGIEALEAIEHPSGDPASVAAWLEERGVANETEIPPLLEGQPLLGCALLSWHGHPVSLLCFGDPDGGEAPVWHLASLPAEAVPAFDAESDGFARVGDWSVAAWLEGGRVRLLASKGEVPASLRRVRFG